MSSNTTKTGTDKKVQVNERELVDPQTGETVQVKQIVERSKDANFQKMFMMHILDALDEVTTKKFDVVMHLLEEKNNQNLIISTHKQIAKEINASPTTVSNTMKILKEKNFLTMINKGVYRINPNMIFKGGHNQRMDVLRTYYKEKSAPVEGQTSIED